jgi:hypothetical protein
LEKNHEQINEAVKGDKIAIKTGFKVRENDDIYVMKEVKKLDPDAR